MNKCRLIVLFIAFFIGGIKRSVLNAQSVYTKDVEERIKNVESNLMGWVIIGADSAWTIEERMRFYGVKGLSIAVIDDFKIDWAKGYGLADEGEKRPVTTKTLFQAASITKSFNTTGVLKLYQDGKVDLYKDINIYLNSWKFPYDSKSGGKTINLSNILSHTGGLSVHGFDGYKLGKELPNVIQMLNGKKPSNIKPVRSMYAPGLKFEYSGGGLIISQLLVMDVTKQPYAEYMQNNILKPLEMTGSSYTQPPTEEMQKVIATGYYETGKEVEGKYNIYPELAPGGLWTTPSDLCKYIIETQLSYLGRSNKILSQEFAQLRLKTVIADIEPNCDLIMGGFVFKRKGENYFFHGGGNLGYTALYFGSFKTGKGFAVMCNENGSVRLLKEIANSVAKVYNWIDFPLVPVHKNIITIQETELKKYIGKYKLSEGKCKIVRKENDLYAKFEGDSYKLYFTSPTDFFVMDQWQKEYKMLVNGDGKFTGEIVNK